MDQHLLDTALRVVKAYGLHTAPDPCDVETLRKSVPEPESHQSADLLAVQIIQQEVEKIRARWAGH